MEKRTFVNPAINDSATFLKTSTETGGAYTLMEIELGKSNGPPLHYHNAFLETFEVKDGVLYLQVGKEKKTLHTGDSVTIPAGTHHRFYNETDDVVTFHITLEPGHAGMARAIFNISRNGNQVSISPAMYGVFSASTIHYCLGSINHR